jgi:hypothetical protein
MKLLIHTKTFDRRFKKYSKLTCEIFLVSQINKGIKYLILIRLAELDATENNLKWTSLFTFSDHVICYNASKE